MTSSAGLHNPETLQNRDCAHNDVREVQKQVYTLHNSGKRDCDKQALSCCPRTVGANSNMYPLYS